MSSRLTVQLDENLIEAAKEYSARVGKPISRILAEFFEIAKNGEAEHEMTLTPTVRSLRGILKGRHLDEEDYKRHLEEKFS